MISQTRQANNKHCTVGSSTTVTVTLVFISHRKSVNKIYRDWEEPFLRCTDNEGSLSRMYTRSRTQQGGYNIKQAQGTCLRFHHSGYKSREWHILRPSVQNQTQGNPI